MMGKRIGKQAWDDLIPLKRMLDVSIRVGCGSDWGPKNIFEHIQLAQTHRFEGSNHCNNTPSHAVGREEAILMWTRDAARVLGWDGLGTLIPGSLADIIIVDQDPLSCDLDALPGTKVIQTFLGGVSVYKSDESSGSA